MSNTEPRDIPVTMPTLAPLSELFPLLESAWKTGILTHNGPLVQRFEKEAATALGVPRLVAVSNGTIALQMAIRALEIRGEIITTPFTFVATLSSILWENCTPVFVDIDPDTFNLDPAQIESVITPRTRAIMPVHVFGNPCETDTIERIARAHGLKVIYDAAHAVGVRYKGRSLLSYGDISATSFHATKMLNTAEGGACIALDPSLHEKLKSIRFFGFNDRKEVVTLGFNGKMTEVHAALGLANLKWLPAALNDRAEKYARYKALLSRNPHLSFQKINESSNFSYFPVVFPTEEALLACEARLNRHRIFPRRYFYPPVHTFYNLAPPGSFPIAESISSRILCLPLYYSLPMTEIERIAHLVLTDE